ncbi:hypothetical protein CKO50_05620 [Pseudoalteromonas sp. HM-SA03]|uniref:hypothetical protein n=1 Tax=Pseudoalteromonas sp. HM-SA03 TaxID=2029678 RepID=UPI000BAE4D38|nr:hypothetical protein [Pseudoalteromonas sp. HM-SA03]PAY02325.1 hypothetical protein CKO50_05620 [Pseudoalteromonas sp. HM-SA03]
MNAQRLERILSALLPSFIAKQLAKSPKLLLFVVLFITLLVIFIIKVASFAIYSLVVGAVLFGCWMAWSGTKRIMSKRKKRVS